MFRPRVIPVLLLKERILVKTTAFSAPQYIGDPINAVRIFNDSKADELVFLDISATAQNRLISLDFVREVGEEANMPFAVGGGIRTLDHIREVIAAGAEKVIIGTAAADNPDFVRQASEAFGASTIVVCMDVNKNWLGRQQVWVRNASKATGIPPIDFAKKMEEMGAGELIIQSVSRDGTMKGYDIELTKAVADAISIPVVALGGAGSLTHLAQGYREGHANGLAAGSMFVYQGTRKGVLINYPERAEMNF